MKIKAQSCAAVFSMGIKMIYAICGLIGAGLIPISLLYATVGGQSLAWWSFGIGIGLVIQFFHHVPL